MRANTWHGKNDVRVVDMPNPTIVDSRDAIVKVTLTASGQAEYVRDKKDDCINVVMTP